MKKFVNINFITVIGTVFATCLAGYFYLVNSIMPKYIKEMLPVAENAAKEYINGSVSIGGLTWNGGLTAEIDNVVIKDLQNAKVAVLPKTKLHLRPWMALIKTERALSKIELLEPEVWLRLQKDDKWNMTSLMKSSESEETPFYGLLEVQKGKLKVDTPYGNWDFGVKGSVDGGANPKFALATEVNTPAEQIKVSGLVTTKGIGSIQVNTNKLNLASYAPLVNHYTNIREFTGDILKTHILWENSGKGAAVSGEAEFANLSGKMSVGSEEHAFVVDGKVKAAKSILDVQRLDAVLDNNQELHLKGKADVHDLDNIGGQGLLTSPKLEYKAYAVEKVYLPFTLSKKLLQIDKASVQYGGGTVNASATADLRDKTLTADVTVADVAHVLSDKPDDIIHANGAVAVLGRMEEKDGRETFQIHAGADTFKLQWQDLLINKLALDGDFDGKKLTIDHFSAWTGDGVFALKGAVEPNPQGAIALEGRIADFGIGPALNHFANLKGKGKLSMNFKTSGTVDSPVFGTMVQLRDIEILNHKLKEMHGFVGMKDNVLKIKRMGATLSQGRHFLDGTVDLNPADPVMQLDLESKHVRVEPLVALATKDFSLTGNLDNIMHISGTPKHPRIEGQMALTDGSVQTYLLNGISGKYLYDDGFVSLNDFLVKLFVADVKFSGTMTKAQALDFNIEASNVDVSKSPYKDPALGIDGLLDIKGHIGGFVKTPYFDGNIASSKLVINGETYTDIAGTVNSNMNNQNNFDISFNQPYKNSNAKLGMSQGTFKAKGNLDIGQKYLVGQVAINNGDIGGLLRTAKLDYAVEGNINGLVEICPKGKDSGIVYNLDSSNIRTHNLKYDKLLVNGTFNKQVADISEILLQENRNINNKGFIKAHGIVDLAQKHLDIKAEAVEANPAIVNVAMKKPLDIKGAMNMAAFINGSFDNPKAEAKVEVLNGAVMGVAFDRAGAEASLLEDNIYIKEISGNKDAYGISGKGKIPMDALRAKELRKQTDAEMDVSLNLDNTELGILTAVKYVDWGTGDVKGHIDIKGTLEEPRIYGNLKVEDGTLKFKDVNPVFEHVNLAADFNGEKAELHNLSAQVGKKGNLSLKGYYNLTAPELEAYKFNISAKDAELSYGSMFRGKINSEIEVTPQGFRDYWHRKLTRQKGTAKAGLFGTKTLSLTSRTITKNYRPLVKGNVRLDDVLANVLTLSDSEVGSETNVGLDLKVELGPKIHMQNAMFYDIWLSGGLDIKGGYYSQTTTDTAEDERIVNRHNRGPDGLKIDGGIKADKGSITYLRTVFKVTDANLSWRQPGEILPYVKLSSWARFGKYRVYINIDDSLGDIHKDEILKLTSSPPLEKNTLVRMLTLQRESASAGNEVTNEDLNNVMTAGLQMAVLGNVELWVKQTLGLDQFRIYTGKVNAGIAFDGEDSKKQLTPSEKNRYNILISKYMTDRFMLGYTSDFNSDEKVVFGQYDLGRHFNLTYSEKQKLSGERKHWAGIEYRIDFK